MAYLSLTLVVLFVAFSSGKLDNTFDKSIIKGSKPIVLDVGFLVENPSKQDTNTFAKSMDFVESLSKSLQVSYEGNHVGLVTYGKNPYMVFDFNELFAMDDISDAIKGTSKPSHGSNTGSALMFAKKQLFDNSARPESRKALVVLTSKSSNEKVYKAAEVMKESGVTVYTIGVDAKDALLELNDVASDPIEKHKFLTTSSELENMVKPITDLIWKDAQGIPKLPPPNVKPKKAKAARTPTKSKDDPPQARSNVEESGRMLELGDGKTQVESQDGSNDGGPSNEDVPTKSPMESQGNDPTMPPESLPRESKNSRPTEKSDEATSSENPNPTMAPAAEPKGDEDEGHKKLDVTPAEPAPEAAKPEQEKLAMPIVPSSTPAPAPDAAKTQSSTETPTSSPLAIPSTPVATQNEHEKLSMPPTPSVPSSTPAPLPNEEKLSMPTTPSVPSSTPAPLPNEEKLSMPPTPSVPSSTPAPLPNEGKLSMPTTPPVPLSTPAPLPTKDSPKKQLEGPTNSPALEPTKSDAEKPDASKPSAKASPTKAVAPKAAPTKSKLFSAKKEPTMPAKELAVETMGSRRSNIKTGKSDKKLHKEKTISEKDDKQSKEEELVEDIFEKGNVFNQSESDDTGIQEKPSDSPKHRKSANIKPVVLPKPKPLPYTKTISASSMLGKVCKARVDMVFLLDGSQSSDRMRFTKSLTFVKNIIKSFSVSKDDARVSVAVCAEKPHIVFDLNAFTDLGSIEKAMRSVEYPSGKMFAGGCLKTIKSIIFDNSGRHGVPKILYFMSGGGSKDHVALPSRALRDLGVQVFSLGLGSKYNARELKEIATAPYSDHVLATRYEILGLLRPLVTAQLCRGSGGKLVSRATLKHKKKLLVKLHKKQSKAQPKSEVPKTSVGENVLLKLKEKEAKRKAALKADIKKKLHILLSKLGQKFHDENAIYRSIVYNINGHRDAGCRDYHVLCKTWGKKGFCKDSPKHGLDAFSVQRVCPKTCLVCFQ